MMLTRLQLDSWWPSIQSRYVRFRYVLLPHGHVLGAHRSHHKKGAVSRRSQEILDRSDTSDGVDIAEVLKVHHVSCYESVHTIRRLPTQERCALELDMVIIQTFIERVTYPLCYLYKDIIIKVKPLYFVLRIPEYRYFSNQDTVCCPSYIERVQNYPWYKNTYMYLNQDTWCGLKGVCNTEVP